MPYKCSKQLQQLPNSKCTNSNGLDAYPNTPWEPTLMLWAALVDLFRVPRVGLFHMAGPKISFWTGIRIRPNGRGADLGKIP